MIRMQPKTPNFLTCPSVPELTASASDRVPQPDNVPHNRVDVPRKKYRWLITVVLLVILLALSAPAIINISRAAFALSASAVAFTRAKAHLRRLDLEAARHELSSARLSLDTVRQALHAVGVWRDLPGLGTQLRGLEDAATASVATLEAADELLAVGQTVRLSLTPLQRLSTSLPQLRLARDKLDVALELWNRIPHSELALPLRQALRPVARGLLALHSTLHQMLPLLEVAAPLAGYPDQSRILVLLQNSDELRPSGGFIGLVGKIVVEAGEIKEFAFTDVYNIDKLVTDTWTEVPPAPLAQRLGVKAWYLRDANWSPDFPTSAERALDFYARETSSTPPTVVVAFEPALFATLLRLTGPITVDSKTFTATNFFDQLQYEVERGFLQTGTLFSQRKDIVGKLGAALLERLKTLPTERWHDVIQAITQALNSKHILLYARQPELLASFDANGWTGRAKTSSGDFIWVIDANLAALKTDGVMRKSVSYELDARQPKATIAHVKLTYSNTNQHINWRYTRYRSYTRVYVPEGSVLLSSSGSMQDDVYRTGGIKLSAPVDVTRELGKTVFGAFWSIEPGQTGTLEFTYKLPLSISDQIQADVYHLDWPKQPGADTTQLTLDLKFAKQVQAAHPPEHPTKWGDARYEYQTDSLMDRAFEITWR